jgi:hypothetical protein
VDQVAIYQEVVRAIDAEQRRVNADLDELFRLGVLNNTGREHAQDAVNQVAIAAFAALQQQLHISPLNRMIVIEEE